MALLTVGVLARSQKENERRLAIHPRHLDRIDATLRRSVYLEQGYGERFGIPDEQLAGRVAGLRSRDRLLADCDVIVLPKPLPQDLRQMRAGQVLWGWPHCVQSFDITQLAIDLRLTLIAFEAMNHWSGDGSFHLHVFHKNNELAGYCSVLHAMQLKGSTGAYGRSLRAAVISFGAAGRGAVTALMALGVTGIHVLTHRPGTAVAAPGPSVRMVHFERDPADPARCLVPGGDGRVPMAAYLAGFDIVVNCVLQDTDAPLMFVTEDDLALFSPGALIVDVSCDAGMGFGWARPTSFEDPMLTVGDNIGYYAVDHSPSLLWDSATWEISEALLPYLQTVLGGPAAWDSNETIRRAIEIRDGVIRNPAILSFQHRAPGYPHPLLPLAPRPGGAPGERRPPVARAASRPSRQDGSMATIRSGGPGHDDGTAFVRLRRGKLVDGPSGQRVWDETTEGPYEIVCPGCGDDPNRDWSEISAELRRIRGIYGTKAGAEAALMDHIGMETR